MKSRKESYLLFLQVHIMRILRFIPGKGINGKDQTWRVYLKLFADFIESFFATWGLRSFVETLGGCSLIRRMRLEDTKFKTGSVGVSPFLRRVLTI